MQQDGEFHRSIGLEEARALDRALRSAVATTAQAFGALGEAVAAAREAESATRIGSANHYG